MLIRSSFSVSHTWQSVTLQQPALGPSALIWYHSPDNVTGSQTTYQRRRDETLYLHIVALNLFFLEINTIGHPLDRYFIYPEGNSLCVYVAITNI